MEFKNVIILGELNHALVCNFGTIKGKVKCLEYTDEILPMNSDENGATNINTLHVLNRTLEKILNVKKENGNVLDHMCHIAIPKKLHALIHRGSYKHWLKNNGVADTGTVFDEREMYEWGRFATLYSALFADIAFRDVSYYEMANPRYDIENMKRHKDLIKSMKNVMENHKKEQLKKVIDLDI